MADLGLESTYVIWFFAPSPVILGRRVHWTKQLSVPETPSINTAPVFPMSLEKFGNLGQKDPEVTVSVCHDPPRLALCFLCVLIIRFHGLSIFSWLLGPVKHSPNQRGFLTLTHLFQHDCRVSKEDRFDTNEIFPPQVSLPHRVTSHVHSSLCCRTFSLSKFSFFFRHFYLECPVS